MEQYLYRFRTAERLLGKDVANGKAAVPGELENLEIYFAPPEQLNDPLEGYKEIYWSGDEIVWLNFFRHYLLVLALRSWELDEAVRAGASISMELDIGQFPGNLQGAFSVAFDEMDARLKACDIMQGYVKAFALRENQHYRPELSFYLSKLHFRFLSIVLSVNAKHGLGGAYPQTNPEQLVSDRAERLQEIANIQAYDGTQRNLDAYEKIALISSALSIKTAHVMQTHPVAVRDLITAFVPRYLDQLEQLMYPRWYVACFMKECNNSAIWGSYGDNHRGICLKYRVVGASPVLSLEMNRPVGKGFKGVSYSFQNMPFKEVFYDREYSEIDFFKFLGNVSNEALGGFWYNDGNGNLSTKSGWYQTDAEGLREEHYTQLDFALTSKLPQWESEKEYRLVLNSYLDISDKKHRVLKYRFSSLDGLIFGIKTSLDDKIKAIRIIKAHCDREGLSSFNFYQAYYDPHTKSIQHALLPVTIHDLSGETSATGK